MIKDLLFDFGGYATKSGKITKKGLFYRSKALDKIDNEDIMLLKKLSIKHIIDFRPGDYVTLYPDKILNSDYFVYWNFQMVLTPIIIQDYFAKKFSRTDIAKSYFDLNPGTVRCTFNTIYNAINSKDYNGEAFLFHCNNGRSRAGLICVVLLILFGVDKQKVIENYASIHDLMTKHVSSPKLFRKDSADMSQVLDYIIEKYGSIEKYLLSYCRVEKMWIDKIRNLFLI